MSPLGADDGSALRRGVVIHRLLQSLPDIEPAQRADAAARYLARPIHGLGADEQAAIAAETMAIVDSAEFAPLFGPESRAEVPIVGRIGKTVVSGRIDRLALAGDRVLIVDYKSHRIPPDRIEDVSPIFFEQLSAYRAVLSEIYPDREIRCALLWTAVPRLMTIDPKLLTTR
jgi:ATP-dependent helicase/nuclease subunit A